MYDLAVDYMERKISTHKFYETKIAPDGTPYSIHKSNKIEHPIALDDLGCRYMTLLLIPRISTDEHLPRLIVRTND